MIHLYKDWSAPLLRWLCRSRVPAVWLGGLLIQSSAAGANDSSESILDSLLSAEIQRPRVFTYRPSQRDPFLDASANLSVLAGKDVASGGNEEFCLDQFSRELNAELLQKFRINGVVCGQLGGVVLIGRRVLRVGDSLELTVGEELARKMKAAEENGLRRLREALNQGVVSLRVESITQSGIGLANDLLRHPLSLPYSKNMLSNPTEQTTTAPK